MASEGRGGRASRSARRRAERERPPVADGRVVRPAAPLVAPGETTRSWVHSGRALWIIAATALTMRLLYLFQVSHTPYYYPSWLDPLFYFNWARTIAAGNWIGDRIFVQSPLYAYVLAIFIRVFG